MRLPRLRFTVRGMMVLIAFMALASALAIQSTRLARRDRELAALGQSLAAVRMEWAERMHKKGYLSTAQRDAEKRSVRKVATSLGLQD